MILLIQLSFGVPIPVAYYPFDEDLNIAYSGTCDPLYVVGQLNDNTTLRPINNNSQNYHFVPGKYGTGLLYKGEGELPGGLYLGSWTVGDEPDQDIEVTGKEKQIKGLTITMWLYVNSSLASTSSNSQVILSKGPWLSKTTFGVYSIWLDRGQPTIQLKFALDVNDDSFQATLTASDPQKVFPHDTWSFWTFVFDDKIGPTIYANGTRLAYPGDNFNIISLKKKLIASDEPIYLFQGNPSNDSQTTLLGMDELRFFSYALNDEEIIEVMHQSSGPVSKIPKVSIVRDSGTPGSTSHPVLDVLVLQANIENPSNVDYNLTWDVASTTAVGCVDIGYSPNKNADRVALNFTTSLGDYVFGVCLMTANGQAVASLIDITLDPSKPEILSQSKTDINVNIGDTPILKVSATGFPIPLYQWEELIAVGPDQNATKILYKLGTTKFDPRDDWNLYSSSFGNVTNRVITKYAYLYDNHGWRGAAVSPYSSALLLGDYKLTNDDDDLSDTTDKKSKRQSSNVVYVWRPVEGATFNTFQLPREVESDDDGKQFRVLVYNSYDRVFSDVWTLHVSDGSSAADVGPIIGGVLGGVLGLLCCIILIIALILFILFKRGLIRRRINAISLKPPNYDELAYTSFLEPLYDLSPKDTNKLVSDLHSFEELLFRYSNLLAITLCESEDASTEVIKSIVWIFQSHDEGYNLLSTLITREVEDSAAEGTLFRANSSACTYYTVWVRTFGIPYIWETLVVAVNELNDTARKKDDGEQDVEGGYQMAVRNSKISKRVNPVLAVDSMEVDPLKMESVDLTDRTVNTLHLWLVAQKLFTAILKSERDVPNDVRKVLKDVNELVKDKFDDTTAFRGMGAFMFLRYICPSLLAPHQWGLLQDIPHPTAQRQLILLGKVIQNLANKTLPGSKEDYMKKLNEFIETNGEPLSNWYDAVIREEGPEYEMEVPTQVKNNSLMVLYEHVYANEDEILKCLRKEDGGNEVIAEWNTIKKQIGKPKYEKTQ